MSVDPTITNSQIVMIKVENSKSVCIYCGLSFNHDGELSSHITGAHFDNVFHCEMCDTVQYETKEELTAHIESHLTSNYKDENKFNLMPILNEVSERSDFEAEDLKEDILKKFSCDICGNSFTKQFELKRHVKYHKQDVIKKTKKSDIQHPCNLCEQIFTRKCDLTIHVKMTHQFGNDIKSEPVKAEYIPEENNTKISNLKIQGCTKNEKFTCNICDKKLKRSSDLKRHITTAHPLSTHSNKKIQNNQLTQPCLVQIQNNETNQPDLLLILPAPSGFDVPTKENAMSDKKVNLGTHQNPEEEVDVINRAQVTVNGQTVYKCAQCDRCMKTQTDFINHMCIHSVTKPFICHVCGKQFRALSILNSHVRDVHERLKRYPCDICGRKFAYLHTRDDHRRTHTGECPCICDICGKAFKSKSSLYFHSRFHSNIFPYQCSYCEKRYRVRQQLKRHIMSHTGEKSNPCDRCGKVFRFKSGLKKHKINHESKEKVECQICNKSFSQLRYLKIHVRSHNLRNLNESLS